MEKITENVKKGEVLTIEKDLYMDEKMVSIIPYVDENVL